jgi:hypothetical protein
MGGEGHRNVGAVKFPRQRPIALEVKIGWKQGKSLRSEEDSVKGIDSKSVQQRKKMGICAEFCVWRAALRRNLDRVLRECVLAKLRSRR